MPKRSPDNQRNVQYDFIFLVCIVKKESGLIFSKICNFSYRKYDEISTVVQNIDLFSIEWKIHCRKFTSYGRSKSVCVCAFVCVKAVRCGKMDFEVRSFQRSLHLFILVCSMATFPTNQPNSQLSI